MTASNESVFAQLGVIPPTECGDPAYNCMERKEYRRRPGQANEGLADARLPVPLYLIAAAALGTPSAGLATRLDGLTPPATLALSPCPWPHRLRSGSPERRSCS